MKEDIHVICSLKEAEKLLKKQTSELTQEHGQFDRENWQKLIAIVLLGLFSCLQENDDADAIEGTKTEWDLLVVWMDSKVKKHSVTLDADTLAKRAVLRAYFSNKKEKSVQDNSIPWLR